MDIYALRDPLTQEIRYIGVSEDPLRRWREHTFDPQGPKAAWVQGLMEQGHYPWLDILGTVRKGEDWREVEQTFIRAISARHRLFNLQGR